MAFEEAGIGISSCDFSEVDKYCIRLSDYMFPEDKCLGDVCSVKGGDYDIIVGGSPCQDLRPGRDGLRGEKSKLFYEYVRVLNECREANPGALFLLENVARASKEDQSIISGLLGVDPIRINSNLVSAQNRDRLYWTNIPDVTQPEDKGIVLSDIIGEPSLSYLIGRGSNSGGIRAANGKTGALTANSWQNNNFVVYTKKNARMPKKNQLKSGCLTGGGNSGGNHSDMDVLVFDGVEIPVLPSGRIDIHRSEKVRRYTIEEFAKLQTIPDRYIEKMLSSGISHSQLFKMIGNGWTVDVISHIFSFI